MSLNINITSNTIQDSFSDYGSKRSLKASFDQLRHKSATTVGSGLKVEFSARYNSKLTAFLANGQVSDLLRDLKPSEMVHKLSHGAVNQLV